MLGSIVALSACLVASVAAYGKFNGLTDSLLQDLMTRYGGHETGARMSEGGDYDSNAKAMRSDQLGERVAKDMHKHRGHGFQARMDDLLLDREPSIRDQEYLEHSSLWGHQYMQGGAGEGHQMLKPDGSVKNVQVIKTDAMLPAYCNPPNPCPFGYTGEDGCLDDFENTAAFSREYQSAQECMCDTEHMFDCPGNTEENELDALARSLQNHALSESSLDKFVENVHFNDEGHKVVAKKFFTKKSLNPYLTGDRLPVIAKKSPHTATGHQ